MCCPYEPLQRCTQPDWHNRDHMRFTHVVPSDRPSMIVICCCAADLLVKCKGMTDPTLAVAVDKIKKTVTACPCGLKYKELTDKVTEQTATTGASDICSTEIQKIVKGAVLKIFVCAQTCSSKRSVGKYLLVSVHTV